MEANEEIMAGIRWARWALVFAVMAMVSALAIPAFTIAVSIHRLDRLEAGPSSAGLEWRSITVREQTCDVIVYTGTAMVLVGCH